MSTIVLPGDRLSLPSSSNVKLGPGLAVPATQKEDNVHELVVTLPGYLGQVTSDKGKAKAKAADQMQVDGQGEKQVARWVENQSMRYLPALHDSVICQITNRGTESYQVTLFNSYTQATVSAFAFEGATKRNKPNLKVGTLLYAQVMSANRHLEVELTCVDPSTGKSNGYGELKTEAGTGSDNKEASGAIAMIWRVSCGLSRR
jgi:exosome complex component RRP40